MEAEDLWLGRGGKTGTDSCDLLLADGVADAVEVDRIWSLVCTYQKT